MCHKRRNAICRILPGKSPLRNRSRPASFSTCSGLGRLYFSSNSSSVRASSCSFKFSPSRNLNSSEFSNALFGSSSGTISPLETCSLRADQRDKKPISFFCFSSLVCRAIEASLFLFYHSANITACKSHPNPLLDLILTVFS